MSRQVFCLSRSLVDFGLLRPTPRGVHCTAGRLRACYITHGRVLRADLRFGEDTIPNINCTPGRDKLVRCLCTVVHTAAAPGKVRLQSRVQMGTDNLLRGVRAGLGVMVGVGAAVPKNVVAGMLVAGNPAKRALTLKCRETLFVDWPGEEMSWVNRVELKTENAAGAVRRWERASAPAAGAIALC